MFSELRGGVGVGGKASRNRETAFLEDLLYLTGSHYGPRLAWNSVAI